MDMIEVSVDPTPTQRFVKPTIPTKYWPVPTVTVLQLEPALIVTVPCKILSTVSRSPTANLLATAGAISSVCCRIETGLKRPK